MPKVGKSFHKIKGQERRKQENGRYMYKNKFGSRVLDNVGLCKALVLYISTVPYYYNHGTQINIVTIGLN